MMLQVEDPEIGNLASELARLERSTVSEVVRRALRERHAALVSDRAERDRRIREFLAEVDRMPVLDPRDHGEMLYGEDGLPR
jgi:hypothetical protein